MLSTLYFSYKKLLIICLLITKENKKVNDAGLEQINKVELLVVAG